jgi:superfamily II DNA or RNA helicase
MGLRRALYHCIGLSATPFGSNHDRVLLQSLGRQIYQYDYDTAVSQGVIAPFIVSEIGASFFSDEMKKYIELTEAVQMCLARLLHSFPQLAGLSKTAFIRAVSKMASNADMDPAHPAAAFMIATYRRKEVSNLATARIRCALMLIEALRHTDRILVFCERISQAEQMVFELKRKFGNCCEIYHSKMGHAARKRAMEAFRDRRSRILVSCRCLDEGIDVPDANVAIVLSSTAVSRQRIQRLGRVIRRSDQKDCACLYYIYIRESTEDSAYLQGLEECESFSMRYFTQEGVFSNELYEYVASELLNRARNAGLSEQQIREFRRCLEEGLVRPDALLTEKIQCEKIKQADSVHDRNYWTVMKKTGQSYRNNDTGA